MIFHLLIHSRSMVQVSEAMTLGLNLSKSLRKKGIENNSCKRERWLKKNKTGKWSIELGFQLAFEPFLCNIEIRTLYHVVLF